VLGLAIGACIFMVISQSKKALFLFAAGMLTLGAVLCHIPWTALRYHGGYFVLLILSYWTLLRNCDGKIGVPSAFAIVNLARRHATSMVTGLLVVHAIVATIFLIQEQVVPFSGSKAAAEIIRKNAPRGSLVIGDPDFLMIPLAGYLDQEIFIASRRELGSFTKIDAKRRPTILTPGELSEVISEQLAMQQRDIVLVTGYEIGIPKEIGRLIGVTRSICGENYFVYLVHNSSARL